MAGIRRVEQELQRNEHVVSDGAAEAPLSDSSSTVYNGSVPCVGCGAQMTPLQAAYVYPDKHCTHCRRKKHRRHVKKGMHS